MRQKTTQQRGQTNVGSVGTLRAGRGDGSAWDVAADSNNATQACVACDREYEAELLPGTLAAQAHSCRCPIWANRFGAGAVDLPLDEDGNAQYWVDAACPLHSNALQAENGRGSQAGAWLCVALVVSVFAFGGSVTLLWTLGMLWLL